MSLADETINVSVLAQLRSPTLITLEYWLLVIGVKQQRLTWMLHIFRRRPLLPS